MAEVIRQMGISEQTFYRRKNLYGRLGAGELRRLKQLEGGTPQAQAAGRCQTGLEIIILRSTDARQLARSHRKGAVVDLAEPTGVAVDFDVVGRIGKDHRCPLRGITDCSPIVS